jgi:hypothetical protein
MFYLGSINMNMHSEVLTAVIMKLTVFWVVTPCKLERLGHFGGRQTASQVKKQNKESGSRDCFLLALIFDPEERDDIFPRNVGLSPNCRVQKTVLFNLHKTTFP